MNNSVYRFTLDVQKSWSQTSIPVKQGDTKRDLHITLSDGGTPFIINDGCLANFVGKKADGTTLYNTCEVEENNTVIYKFTEQTSNVPGVVDCEIEVIDTDSKVIASGKFILVVDERVNAISEVVSADEAETIRDYLLNEAARVKAESERENAEATRKAFYDGFSGKLSENTEALRSLKMLVGESLPEGVTEKTVIAYIKSVAGELASEIKNRGTAISEALKTARGYADTKKGEAQQYTDGKVTYLQGEISTAKENAISESKTYTDNKVAELVNGAPETLDTLDELAAALDDNKDIVEVLNSAIGSKVSTEVFNTKVAELEGDMAGKLNAKFEAISDNVIRFVVANPDGSIEAKEIATGGSY